MRRTWRVLLWEWSGGIFLAGALCAAVLPAGHAVGGHVRLVFALAGVAVLAFYLPTLYVVARYPTRGDLPEWKECHGEGGR